MTSRDRVFTTISHNEPDRIPYNLRLSDSLKQYLKQKLGDIDFDEYFHHDIRYVKVRLKEEKMYIPDLSAWDEVSDKTHKLQERGLIVCSGYHVGVFEELKGWLGDAEALIIMHEKPGEFFKILEQITEWKCKIYGGYVSSGVDIVWIGDDLGSQNTLIMNPVDYRKWYRPCHQQIIKYLRSIRSDIIIAYHSCGCILPIIPDLIEIGIDIFETVQPEVMDIKYLKNEYGKDLTFWGAIGQQCLLSCKISQQVIDGMKKVFHIMAPGGGFIVAPSNRLIEDISYENMLAFYNAIDRYGNYPDGWLNKD